MSGKLFIERQGVNTTFQDEGRFNLQHLGIPPSGCMDIFLSRLANKLVGNKFNQAVIEFAYQGPLFKVISGEAHISITGNVKFEIIKGNGNLIKGLSNSSFYLEKEDKLNIISTIESIYGYLSIEGGFKLLEVKNSFSTLIKANIGPNQGKKIGNKQEIIFSGKKENQNKKVFFQKDKSETIRVLNGLQRNFFSEKSIKDFYSNEYTITNLTDRMGARLNGIKLQNIKTPNIKSEGIAKGSIQIPGDGLPIVLLSDHPTIGGYPKIANIISADYAKFAQKPPGTKIKFQLVNLNLAESEFDQYTEVHNAILNSI
jgi:biotin-dependent carboxylase-like uncharacterized protein